MSLQKHAYLRLSIFYRKNGQFIFSYQIEIYNYKTKLIVGELHKM